MTRFTRAGLLPERVRKNVPGSGVVSRYFPIPPDASSDVSRWTGEEGKPLRLKNTFAVTNSQGKLSSIPPGASRKNSGDHRPFFRKTDAVIFERGEARSRGEPRPVGAEVKTISRECPAQGRGYSALVSFQGFSSALRRIKALSAETYPMITNTWTRPMRSDMKPTRKGASAAVPMRRV